MCIYVYTQWYACCIWYIVRECSHFNTTKRTKTQSKYIWIVSLYLRVIAILFYTSNVNLYLVNRLSILCDVIGPSSNPKWQVYGCMSVNHLRIFWTQMNFDLYMTVVSCMYRWNAEKDCQVLRVCDSESFVVWYDSFTFLGCEMCLDAASACVHIDVFMHVDMTLTCACEFWLMDVKEVT